MNHQHETTSMNRRDFCEFLVAVAGADALPSHALASTPLADEASPPPAANYPNNRAPLQPSRYVKLPLGSGRPTGWLLDQLTVQANGLTSHLNQVWNIADESSWKGNVGVNVTPECCSARYVPRWLEGLTVLSGVLQDDRLSALGKPYMEYALSIKDLATVTPSVTAWCHFGRFMPEYYQLTGDPRAIHIVRAILDYADSVRNSKDTSVFDPNRVGMLLSFGIWYYNQTGEKDILAMLDRATKACIDDWTNYFSTFPQDPKYFVHFPDVTAQKSPNQPLVEWTRQGIDVTQAIQYPILHSLISGNRKERDSVLEGIANLDNGYGQVGGRWAADEWLASTDPTAGTELCGVEETLFCFENCFAIMGDVRFADRVEQLIFNAFPGTTTADMWAHQYDQQANQVLVSVARRPWHNNRDNSNIYGFTPNFPCCLSNMHSPWPRYVESMWMATADNGLIALAYGPSRYTAKVANGKNIEVVEDTRYPFSDRVRVTVRCSEPLSFPLHFRIPSWANRAEVSIAGQSAASHPESGTVFRIDREWKDGDAVTLNFNFKVRTETRQNNAVAVAWGPLYFVLRIGEAFESVPTASEPVQTPATCVNWHIAPITAWNYALSIDRHNPQCEMIFNKIGSIPFAQKGEPVRAAGSSEFIPWHGDVPMILKFKAKLVPQWGMNGANAAPVPVSPVSTSQPETVVELIPYGCSRLRIAEFPTL